MVRVGHTTAAAGVLAGAGEHLGESVLLFGDLLLLTLRFAEGRVPDDDYLRAYITLESLLLISLGYRRCLWVKVGLSRLLAAAGSLLFTDTDVFGVDGDGVIPLHLVLLRGGLHENFGEARFVEPLAQIGVEAVFDGVIGAARHLLRDVAPAVAVHQVQFHDQRVLL